MKRKDQETQSPGSTYQTGSTTPPKKYNLLVVILLILVIFFAGLSSILGLLNFKLFSAFYEQEQPEDIPFSLAQDSEISDAQQEASIPSALGTKIIGITGDPLTPVYQRHFGLPEGLFITYVEEGTSAAKQGIREGDVLISLEDTKITDQSHIQAFLEDRAIGDTFQAVVYRRDTDTRLTVQLTVEEASS